MKITTTPVLPLKGKKPTSVQLSRDQRTLLTQITAEVEEIAKRYKLEYWQVELAKELAKPKAFRMSIVDLSKKLGVEYRKFEYWKTHPVITKIRMELTRLHFFNDIPDVIMAVKDNALRGDTRAAELFFEMVLELKLHDQANEPPAPYVSQEEVAVYIVQIRKKHNMPIPVELQEIVDKFGNQDEEK